MHGVCMLATSLSQVPPPVRLSHRDQLVGVTAKVTPLEAVLLGYFLMRKSLAPEAAKPSPGGVERAQEEQEAAANVQATDAEVDGRSRRRSFIAQLKQDDEEQQRRLAREPAEAIAGSAGVALAGDRAAAKLDDALPAAAAVDADKVSLAERATEPAAARPKASPKEADGDSGVGAPGSAPESAEETVAEAQQVSSTSSKLEIVEA